MATNTAGQPGVIDSVVIGTVHMHIKKGVASELVDLVVTSFTQEEILNAKSELIDFMGMAPQGGHNDTAERSAVSLYTKELVAIVQELDKDNRMPKVVVSSDQLAQIPLGKKGLSPSEAVPISSRMNDLEDTVKRLCESFDKFKSGNKAPAQEISFAAIAGRETGTRPKVRQGQSAAANPAVTVSAPGQQGGVHAHGPATGGQAQPDHSRGQGLSPPNGSGRDRVGSTSSVKRGRDGDVDSDGFKQPYRRKNRKVTYGKSQVTMEGAEAAPIEIFIGNTNPKATPDIIEKVMKKCAGNLPEKVELTVLEVKCLNNLEKDPSPRTRCWKITVPYVHRELMDSDELYPTGWSYRKFFAPRSQQNKAKRHHADPVLEHLSGADESNNATEGV